MRVTLIVALFVATVTIACGGRQPRDQLHAYAERGQIGDAAALLDGGKVQVDEAAPDHGRTALIAAAGAGQLEMIKFLVARGANLEQRNASGETALLYACGWQQVAAVKVLLELGADRAAKASNGWDCRVAASPEKTLATAAPQQSAAAIDHLLESVVALAPDAPERQADLQAASAAAVPTSSDDEQARTAHIAFLGGGISYGEGGSGLSVAAYAYQRAGRPGIGRLYMRATLSNAAGGGVGAGVRVFGRATLGARVDVLGVTPEGASDSTRVDAFGGELGWILQHTARTVLHPVVFAQSGRLGAEVHAIQSLFTYARPDRQHWRVALYGSAGFDSVSLDDERYNRPYLTLGLMLMDIGL